MCDLTVDQGKSMQHLIKERGVAKLHWIYLRSDWYKEFHLLHSHKQEYSTWLENNEVDEIHVLN